MFYVKKDKDATLDEIKSSFKSLSNALFFCFQKNVVILLDEYDKPFNNMLKSNLFSETDFEKTLTLVRDLMRITFQENKYLYKGLLNGLFTISKDEIFSDFNNLAVFSFSDKQFAPYFCFNEHEIDYLFQAYNIEKCIGLQAKDWYGGYRVAGSDMQLYHPWSIVVFLSQKKLSNYWTRSIQFFDNILKKQ